MVLIQCHGKSRAIQCRYIICIHGYLLFMCVYMRFYAWGTFFIISPILPSMKYHLDYDTSDGRVAGNRCPYPVIFQRSIKCLRKHELCQTHLVVYT